jgi:hypothetical protein
MESRHSLLCERRVCVASVLSPLSCVLWQVLTTVLRQSDSEERVLGVLDRVLSMLQTTPLPSPPPTWSASSSQTPPPAPNVRTLYRSFPMGLS